MCAKSNRRHNTHNLHRYSITSSTRASKVAGIVKPERLSLALFAGSRRTGMGLLKPAAGVPILLNSPAGADWSSGSLMNADRLDAVSQLVGCQRRTGGS